MTIRRKLVAGGEALAAEALDAGDTVYKYDGTSWSVHTTIPSTNRPGVFVDGTNTLWIAGNAGTSSYMTLYRSVNGVVTTVGHSTSAAYASAYGAAP